MTTKPTTAEQAMEALERLVYGHNAANMGYEEQRILYDTIKAALQSERQKIGDWGDKSKARLPEVSEAVYYGRSEREKEDGVVEVTEEEFAKTFLSPHDYHSNAELQHAKTFWRERASSILKAFPNGLKIIKGE